MRTEFINELSQLVIIGMRLSQNPEAKVIPDPDGVNGKINITNEDGKEPRKYYIVEFGSVDNPFAYTRFRVISQTHDATGSPVWRAGSPDTIRKFMGKTVPGDLITREVVPYDIDDKTVNTFTCAVLKGENIYNIFKSFGHVIIDPVDAITVKKAESVEETDSYIKLNKLINATKTSKHEV